MLPQFVFCPQNWPPTRRPRTCSSRKCQEDDTECSLLVRLGLFLRLFCGIDGGDLGDIPVGVVSRLDRDVRIVGSRAGAPALEELEEPATTRQGDITDKPKVPGTVFHKGRGIHAPSAHGVGRGVSPRPQPRTGRAGFQASGFPDDSVLIVPSEPTLDFLHVHREASRSSEPFGRPAQIILHPFAM